MKLIIAGSRHLDVSWQFIWEYIRKANMETITEIVSGACPTGPDRAGEVLAEELELPCKKFPADWDKFGKSAGPRRNDYMSGYGDVLLLIWDGESKGSSNIKHLMITKEKPVYEIILRKHNEI